MMKACVGMPWEAKVDVPHWLKELENLKVRAGEGGAGRGYVFPCVDIMPMSRTPYWWQ